VPETSSTRALWQRVLTASPLGIAVIVVGIAAAIFSFVRLGVIAGDVEDNDVEQLVQALRLTLPVIWLAGTLWGFQLIDTALQRKEMRTRLEAHQETLDRIEQALTEHDVRKQVEVQKARTFWDKVRSGF
jgi:hypothetical protein